MTMVYDNATTPVTALFDQDGNQLFETAVILDMDTAPSKTFAEHVLEDGTVVSDNSIENQVRINVSAVLDPADFKEVYAKIKDAFKKDFRFTIQNRVDTFDAMYIESYPYRENAGMANTIGMSISFIEQKFAGAKVTSLPPSKVKNPSDADPVDSGTKLPSEQSSSTLLELFGGA